jgi:hypothetical protein
MLDPTPEEAKAIKALKRLAKAWPPSLWLFSASGTLNVMRVASDGGHAFTGDAIDQSYVIDTIAIPNDGGDW